MSGLRLYLLNVGRGDCILMRFPDGSWAVVDCGNDEGHYRPPRQAHVVMQNTEPANAPIRFVLATHPHLDHDGGITQLLHLAGGARDVHAVYYSGFMRRSDHDSADNSGDDATIDFVSEASALADKGKIREVRALNEEQDLELDPPIKGLSITVLPPRQEDMNKASECRSFDRRHALGNNVSVVLKVEYKGRSIILPGDIEGHRCSQLFADPRAKRPDVVKAPHHGARSASGLFESIEEATCRFVLVSCPTAREKHPHIDFLQKAKHAGEQLTIRCTGLSKYCNDKQAPDRWPKSPRTFSDLEESIRRSLATLAPRRRLIFAEEYVECSCNNVLTITESGEVLHSVEQRACDQEELFA